MSSRIPFNTGRWTDREHQGFVRGLESYGHNWDAIGITFVPTRSSIQIQAHALQHFSGGTEPSQRLDEDVQHTPGAGTSSSPPSPAPSLSSFHSSNGNGGFEGGGDGDGDGDGAGYNGEGDGFSDDSDGFGGGDGEGESEGGGGGRDDRFDDNPREALALGRAILDRHRAELPARRVWNRAGSLGSQAAQGNHPNTGEAMRRSFDLYDPLGVL